MQKCLRDVFHSRRSNLFSKNSKIDWLFLRNVISILYLCSRQVLCLDIEQTQQASDPAELQKWSQLSSRAREELGTLQCILGSMKDNQVEQLSGRIKSLFLLKLWL